MAGWLVSGGVCGLVAILGGCRGLVKMARKISRRGRFFYVALGQSSTCQITCDRMWLIALICCMSTLHGISVHM